MNIFATIGNWARSAWGTITGLPGDVSKSISAIWHYVTSVHNTLSWLFGNPLLHYIGRMLYDISIFHAWVLEAQLAQRRIAIWIWTDYVKPVRDWLNGRINALRAWAQAQLSILLRTVIRLYLASLAYTRDQVAAERSARIRADQAEHAAMVKAVRAALATVQRQASSGYNAGLRERLGVVGQLLNTIADHNPVVKETVTLLVKAVFDLETIDNPAARLLIGKLLSEVIARAGVDRVIGDLIGRLLGPLEGGVRPADLYHVELDVARRLTGLETDWADFMASGGPEVEQAGREWRDITGVATDVALLGFLTLAVTDPQAWATGIADTAGVTGNAAMNAIVGLVSRA